MGRSRRGCQVLTALQIDPSHTEVWRTDRWNISVKEIGCLAVARLTTHARGVVHAVFSRSFYIDLPGGLVCLVNPGLGSCPLNVIAAVPVSTDWRASGVAVHDGVTVIGLNLYVGARFVFDLSGALGWEPVFLSSSVEASRIGKGLKLFRAAARDRLPADGLACLLGTENAAVNKTARHLQREVADLQGWLADGGKVGSVPVSTILGAGPGLTPSGDDFLSGMMIALSMLGEEKLRDRLWLSIYPCAARSGNRISQAHLEAAALGFGHAALHRAIHAIVMNDGRGIAVSVEDLGTIGATSGWDAMAGAGVLLEAWSRSVPTGRRDR